jgi:hypothetical protein
MPRKAKTPSVSTPVTSPGQGYGVAGEQKAAMAAVPLPGGAPDVGAPGTGAPTGASPAAPTPPASRGGAPVPPPAAGPEPAPGGGNPLAQAIVAAISSPAPAEGGFDRPTERPTEDLFTPPAPMRSGRVTPTARVLSMLAESNGNDPALRALADDAARRGY